MTSPSVAPALWYCDTCGREITDPNMSMVVWGTDEEGRDGGYKVVHKGKCDPGSKAPDVAPSSMDITWFLGEEGGQYLLSMLSVGPLIRAQGSGRAGPQDLDEYVDLFRRMQTPHYEEARRHFRCQAVVDDMIGVNESYPYLEGTLKRIAKHPGPCRIRGEE